MAEWVTHIWVADEVLKQLPQLDRHGFCVGNIAPDCNLPNEEGTDFIPSRQVTHWMNGNRKTADDCIEFYNKYVLSRIDEIKAKEECEEREEKPITSKFCGIFPHDSKGEELLKEYEKFFKFLEAKKKQKFNLSDDEINNFFVVNGRLWKIVSGRVVLLVTIDKSYRYEITVELEHILIYL